jgi:hypothetical protein
LLTSALSRAASADPPRHRVAVLVGPALRFAWLRDSHSDPRTITQYTWTLVATIGYRIDERFAVGVHGTISGSSNGHDEELGNTSGFTRDWTVRPADLALAGSYRHGYITVSPWIGRHLTRFDLRSSEYHHVVGGTEQSDVHHTTWSNDFTSLGVTLDFARHAAYPELPLALVVDFQTGLGYAPSAYEEQRYYTSLTVGVAATL